MLTLIKKENMWYEIVLIYLKQSLLNAPKLGNLKLKNNNSLKAETEWR